MNIAYISAALSLIAIAGFAVLWRQHARLQADHTLMQKDIAELRAEHQENRLRHTQALNREERLQERLAELTHEFTPRRMTYQLRDGLTERVERLEAARHRA